MKKRATLSIAFRRFCFLLFCFSCFASNPIWSQGQLKEFSLVKDNTYGKGAKKTVIYGPSANDEKNGIKESIYEYWYSSDSTQGPMQFKVTLKYADGRIEFRDEYYDCLHSLILSKEESKSAGGLVLESNEQKYKPPSEDPVSGKRMTVDENGKKTNYTWDPARDNGKDKKTGGWVQTTSALPPDTNIEEEQQHCSDPNLYNEILFGPSLVIEDIGTDHFNTYGGIFGYTHYLNKQFGLTSLVGVTTGSYQETNFVKIAAAGGILFSPSGRPYPDHKFSFTTHALVGVSHIHSKSKNYNITGNSTSFFGQAGVSLDAAIASKLALRLFQADYEPVFNKGRTSNNFRLSTGLILRLGEH